MSYVNKHLLKKNPLYTANGYVVKLMRVVNTDAGLHFTAEIMEGEHIGKLTSVSKKDLKRIKVSK